MLRSNQMPSSGKKREATCKKHLATIWGENSLKILALFVTDWKRNNPLLVKGRKYYPRHNFRSKRFLLTKTSRPALWSTQPSIQSVPWFLARVKAAREWSWPLTSIYSQGQEWMLLYLHSTVSLQGMVLNWVWQQLYLSYAQWGFETKTNIFGNIFMIFKLTFS